MKQVLSVVALTASLAAATSAEALAPKLSAPPVANGPILVLEQATHEAGAVLKGEVIVAEFLVRNAGRANLEIFSVKPACGCTTPDYDKIVPPGETGRIVLSVDTERFGAGPLMKTASVTTNDPTQPNLRLSVDATVATLVDVSPRDSVTFRHYRGEKKAQVLTIRSQAEGLFAIQRVQVSDTVVKHRLKQTATASDTNHAAWELEVWLDDDAPVGNVSAQLELFTSSARAPVVPIKVRGNIMGQVLVSPSTVHFRVDSEDTAQKVLLVTQRNAGEFELKSCTIKAAKIDADAIEIETEVIRDGSSYRVTVNYAGGLEPGNYTGKVVLGTTDADQPTVEVPLYIVVT